MEDAHVHNSSIDRFGCFVGCEIDIHRSILPLLRSGHDSLQTLPQVPIHAP